jgi:FixJ family two-component response regulator
VRTFGSARSFLEAFSPDQQGCLLVDVHMPEMSGLDLQQQLAATGAPIPVILVTGYGDVGKAVQAMRDGAIDFLEKPFDDQLLLDRIAQAMEVDRTRRAELARRRRVGGLYKRLTRREREVLDLIVAGVANKQIATTLSRSEKTIEIHRAHIMKKMEAGSLAELVRIAEDVERFRSLPGRAVVTGNIHKESANGNETTAVQRHSA